MLRTLYVFDKYVLTLKKQTEQWIIGEKLVEMFETEQLKPKNNYL
jgi:hypothetical protein